ncbi:MAG: flagellar hook-associated protein FlgK [Planctomycetaceae bacterium]|nr:flagellar hook-associated protein FlgK [Planctomycetaceae bacterium]
MSMYSLQVGLSALQANQQALQTVAANIANASTPGYHRQIVRLSDRQPTPSGKLLIGSGVDASRIDRIRNSLIEQSLTSNLTTQAGNTAQLETLQRLEALLTPSDGSISSRLQTFFDRMFAVTSGPDNNVLREQAVSAAHDLTEEINAVGGAMHKLQQQLDAEIDATVYRVNQLSEQITSLNRDIGIQEGRGLEPHDLRDQRDQLLNDLAGLVDVRTWEWAGQQDVASFGEGGVSLATLPMTVSVGSENGEVAIYSDHSGRALSFSGGRLAGLLEARNQIVPDALDRLQTFADTFIRQVDQLQATGLGQNGPVSWLESTRGVADVNAPLASAGTTFPVANGQLMVSVTDLATGARRMVAIDIDPATDSLSDVAAAIDAVDHLQTFVDPQSGKIAIGADDGYAFDFVGRLETIPDQSAVTGTSVAALSGSYTGSTNDELEFTVVGSGQIGVTSGLQVEVRNGAGALVKTINVGLGYEPGAALDVGQGVSVSFAAGTLNAGDTFSTPVVANADTAGFLSAVGLQSFFSGTKVGLMSVRDDLRSSPELLAVSFSGLPADGNNAARIAALRDQLLLGGGSLTLEDFLAESTALIGSDVLNATNAATHLESVGAELEASRQSESGVDPNEELVRMLQYQRGFQSAAKVISTVNETLDELFTIL